MVARVTLDGVHVVNAVMGECLVFVEQLSIKKEIVNWKILVQHGYLLLFVHSDSLVAQSAVMVHSDVH